MMRLFQIAEGVPEPLGSAFEVRLMLDEADPKRMVALIASGSDCKNWIPVSSCSCRARSNL